MDNGFSSPRRDTFPAGLRVLVVDDDPTWLRILEKMLKKCSYEVTTCGLAREALSLLRERKDGYDIVISDVNMPDMDGFKLLEHVGLEMDLPVIMMSVDGETSRVMKGVQHGACDYLLKPIRMKELRNIWQHVFRKRIHEAREFEGHEVFEGIHLMRNGTDQSDDGFLFAVEDMTSMKKRKDVDTKHDDREFGDPSSMKKARVVWSVDLHQKFVKAVNQIGFDKVGPKKILDLMNVPWLTRENVASHLQKYRLYLSRLQKEDDQKSSSSGNKHSDFALKDSPGSFVFQNSTSKQPNDVADDSYKYSDVPLKSHTHNTTAADVAATSHEGDLKGIISESSTEKRRALSGSSIPDTKTRSSQVGLHHSSTLAPLKSEGRSHAMFDCTIPTRYALSEAPEMKIKKERKSLLQSQSVASVSSNPCITNAAGVETRPLYADYKSDRSNSSSLSSKVSAGETVSLQSKSLMMVNNGESPELISTKNSGVKTQGIISDVEFHPKNLLLRDDEAAYAHLEEDYLQFCWLQSECYNLGLQNIEVPEYYDPGLVAEVPPHLLYDSSDYSVIDQGLFIA